MYVDSRFAGGDKEQGMDTNFASPPEPPVSLLTFGAQPLEAIDLLGRDKIVAAGLTSSSTVKEAKKVAPAAFATIERNAFKYKSLSSWAFNIAVGCRHACRFCYVVDAQQTRPAANGENNGPLATALRHHGVVDPDLSWGDYVLLRPWDETNFLASLRRAEKLPHKRLNVDGNRAIILCSTTDPYQTLVIKGNPAKQNLLNRHARFLVRRALELILEHSTLNVRILTRSPLASADFDLYKKFGNRLLFGMSLPTLRQDLLDIYEPHAPSAIARLKTLKIAAEAKIPLFVAVAPTYPDLDEKDIRDVLKAIKPLKPRTVFHEPINIRAENVQRIEEHAKKLGVSVKTDVFDNGATWRHYAIEQLRTVQRIATELGLEGCLHLWPDKKLIAKAVFLKAKDEAFRKANPKLHENSHQKLERRKKDNADYEFFLQWLSHWHKRISEWPGKK